MTLTVYLSFSLCSAFLFVRIRRQKTLVACLDTFDIKYCLTYRQKCRYNIYVASGILLFPEGMCIAVQCMSSALLGS